MTYKLRRLILDWRTYAAALLLVVMGVLDAFSVLNIAPPGAGPLQHLDGGFWSSYQSLLNPSDVGTDYRIFSGATRNAMNGRSAYLPYDESMHFIFPPFSVTIFSLFQIPGSALGGVLWDLANAAAYLAGVIILLRDWQTTPEDRPATRWLPRPPLIFAALILFSPFLANLWFGQNNGVVFFFMVLAFHAAESKTPNEPLAGTALAFAGLLKLTPLALLLYFLVTRRFRIVGFAIAALLGLSLISLIQFGPGIYADFITMLRHMSADSAIRPVYYNYNLALIIARMANDTTHQGLLSGIQRGVTLLLFGVGCLLAYLTPRNDPAPRRWVYGIFVTSIVFASPLVEIHHGIYLLIPLIALLLSAQPRYAAVGLVLLLAVQGEIFFEIALTQSGLAYFGLLFLVAELGLVGILSVMALATRTKQE